MDFLAASVAFFTAEAFTACVFAASACAAACACTAVAVPDAAEVPDAATATPAPRTAVEPRPAARTAARVRVTVIRGKRDVTRSNIETSWGGGGGCHRRNGVRAVMAVPW